MDPKQTAKETLESKIIRKKPTTLMLVPSNSIGILEISTLNFRDTDLTKNTKTNTQIMQKHPFSAS